MLQCMSLLLAHFDRLCGALECPLLGEEQTFVSADCCSTAGLFTATADLLCATTKGRERARIVPMGFATCV
jgi:hypothetical protein